MFKKSDSYAQERRAAMRGGTGETTVEHVWKPGDDMRSPTRMFARLVLNPGCSIGWHVHEDEEEIFYILSGRAAVNDNGTNVFVSEGDSTITRSGEGHSIACEGDEPLVVLACIVKYPRN